MLKFKVGDRVKIVNKGLSTSAKLYNGQIGTIVRGRACEWGGQERTAYYSLDIDFQHGGIWEEELVLVSDFKKEVKQFGIVKFLEGIK